MQDHDHDPNPCVGLGGAPHDHTASCTGSCSAHSPPGTLVCLGTAAGSIAAARCEQRVLRAGSHSTSVYSKLSPVTSSPSPTAAWS